MSLLSDPLQSPDPTETADETQLDMTEHPGGFAIEEPDLEELVPEEYLYDPYNAEPTLDHLRQAAMHLESRLEPVDVINLDDSENEDGDDHTDDDSHHGMTDMDKGMSMTMSGRKKKQTALATLLEAADMDVALHMARVKAVLEQDASLLQTYMPQTDPLLQQRAHRLAKLRSYRDDLQAQEVKILSALNHDLDAVGAAKTHQSTANSLAQKDNVTRANVLQARLAAWEKALQLYIYCPPTNPSVSTNDPNDDTSHASANNNNKSSKSNSHKPPSLSLLQLLHHLTLIAKQDEPLTPTDDESTTLTQTLSHAMNMCTSHLDTVSSFLADANEQSAEEYQSYQIHLIAHSIAANRTLERAEGIHDSFLLHGKEALRIGHALELAEAKRRQSERASVLIRRWWMMENLAEQEEFSGQEIRVMEEVRGVIPSSSCQMDPLFTKVERSLEASRVLKSLRMVVKCQSNAGAGSASKNKNAKKGKKGGGDNSKKKSGTDTSDGADKSKEQKQTESDDDSDEDDDDDDQNNSNNNTGGFMIDPLALKRFERTNQLIQRTSIALEKRLLNAFSKEYTEGGTYDFSSLNAAQRKGRVDWVMLRECAEALMNFDSGRSLHQRYVDLVVTSKFPELWVNYDASDKMRAHMKDAFDVNEGFVTDSEDEHKGENKSKQRLNAEEQQEFDMDATRNKLSELFHRVTEVITEEFQLIAHVFSPNLPPHLVKDSNNRSQYGVVGGVGGSSTGGGGANNSSTSTSSFSETYPLHVARFLLQRIISDPYKGMQAQINELLDSIDKRGDFDAGAKKLDTFVVIHEKAAGLFSLLKDAARKMWDGTGPSRSESYSSNHTQSVSSLIQFLTSQEMALSSGQRRGYLNLELRLLHHECCSNLDRIGAKFLKPIPTYSKKQEPTLRNPVLSSTGGQVAALVEYRAPIMPIDKEYIQKVGFLELLNGPLKSSVLRQPLIHATDSLARARLMFGLNQQVGEDVDSTARVILAIFMQMCNFYGSSYLFPIVESLGMMLDKNPPTTPPVLPFDENEKPHDLGVDGNFWLCIERIHSAAKAFDRELWAENRTGSVRVWEVLMQTRSITSLTLAKDRRIKFFHELEERGEVVILRALDTLSTHIMWILVSGGENMAGSGGTTTRIMKNFTGQNVGPYAVPTGSLLDSTNSPAVKALCFCLRSQFVHIQAALTPQSLSAFWTALSMRLYDILVTRLLLHYYVSTVGAVVLSRDVEALRTVAMLAGTKHSHWDNLRELLTLFMTPPDALRTMLVGPDGDVNSGKGMFGRAGKDQSIVFMSRRVDYRYKTGQGLKKSQWVIQLLEDLGVNDPTDGRATINIAPYSAENMMEKN